MRHPSSLRPQWRRSPGYFWRISRSLHPQNGNMFLHTAPLGRELTGRNTPFTSLSLHLGLHGPLVVFLTLSLHLRLSLHVSGDLQRAMESTHVSFTGCSIRAELRIIFIHLLLSQTQCSHTSIAV